MEIQQARVFLAVAQDGSVSAAARRLYRTQPTVTMAIQKLERELGTRLFERIGHGVRLTPAGHTLRASVAPLLEQWERMHGRVRTATDGVLRGAVRVAGGEGAILYLLPGPIRSFLRRHPRVELDLRQEASGELVALLRRGSIDFAVAPLRDPPPDISFLAFRRSEYVLIAPRGHVVHRAKGLSLEQLARQPLILPGPASGGRRSIEAAFAQSGLVPKIALEAGGWEMVKRYAGLGLGVGIVPDFALEPDDRRLTSRRARGILGGEIYGLLTRRGKDPSPASRALIASILSTRAGF